MTKDWKDEFYTEWERYLCPAPSNEEIGWLERAEIGKVRVGNYIQEVLDQELAKQREEIIKVIEEETRFQIAATIEQKSLIEIISINLRDRIINKLKEM